MKKVILKYFKAQFVKRALVIVAIILGYRNAFSQTAASPASSSDIDYTLAYLLVVIMVLLLVIIWFLSKLLESSADYFVEKWKNEQRKNLNQTQKSLMIGFFLLVGLSSYAGNGILLAATDLISGLPASLFYLMVSLLFVEFVVVIVLAWQVWGLITSKLAKNVEIDEEKEIKENRLTWWDKFNKFKPLSAEADLDLGHNYDGIRELDNKLPPWWLYGFYLTIIVGIIYFYRFSIAHTGPSSVQEYEASVEEANLAKNAFLKKSASGVDENTVALLKDETSIAAGMAAFKVSCSVCHGQKGEGVVGPNLTDDYWIYGGSIKDVFKTIKYGTNKGMQPWKENLSAEKMAQVASYVKSLRGTNPPNAKEPIGSLYSEEVAEMAATDSLKK